MKSEVEKEVGAHVLKKYGSFFKRQCEELNSLVNETPQDNKSFQVIRLQVEPRESIPLVDLLASDNVLITKVLGVLSALCIEVNKLKHEAFKKHFPFLAVYEIYNAKDITPQIREICCLNAFVIRCSEVLHNMCCQVFALYTEPIIKINGIQLHYIINHIGEIFTIIVLLDLLMSNTSLSRNWSAYCKELSNLIDNKSALSGQKCKTINDATHNITLKLMSDNIVQNSLNSLSSLKNKLVDKSSNALMNEMAQYIKTAITNLEKLVQENPTHGNMCKTIKINCLFVLHAQLFGINDKKMFKNLMDLNSKAHSVTVYGTSLWFPEQFLQRYVPSLFATQSKLCQTLLKARQSYLTCKKASVSRDIVQLQMDSTSWILNIDDHFSGNKNQLNASDMNYHSKVLLRGLDIASQVNYSMVTLINLHLSLGIPLSKSMLMAIFEAVDVLKGMKNAVSRNMIGIVNSLIMVVQHLLYQASSSVLTVKKNLMTDKNYANQRLDELTCLVIAEKALKGSATLERIVATHVALSFLPNDDYISDTYSSIGLLLEKVQALITFVKTFDDLCDCSWLLWHQNVLPIYLDQNFGVQLDALRLKYFLESIEDCALLLNNTKTDFGNDKGPDFLSKLETLIYDNVFMNASQRIETNLRLHIHSHLHLDVPNPFTTNMIKKTLFNIDNIRLMSLYMSVIPSVEHYLSTMYYNLTTVVLSDWKTYAEMRQMAKFKFSLRTVDDNLPTQTLEQGLDVLEIMRNIHIFVSKYLYNLNNQIFIEKSSNNKHLNSINIQHIANSIRTHGTGIMNTTVNFTYQFLKKKFFTFSQFLFDEHIKSRLNKDLKNFKENNVTYNNMYPYKNAEKFNKGIRNLGIAEDGQSYLDLFRDLISQIGNAMGYVRMIRSGGRHCCADATVFLPNIDDAKSFKTLCEECDFDATSLHSAEILDQNVENLICNFMQGTEYFKLLVDVFAPIFRNPKNIHLKNFFVIVPPVTINFIEHMILCKDKMTKKNKAGAAFTDDGFAMGVAYILKLLDQDSAFESLHWFEGVWHHIEQERKLLDEQRNKGSTQLQLALALSDKKLKTLEQEFQLLYYSLTSARIFFRQS